MDMRRQIEDELLPFVNGSASREQARRIEELIRSDPQIAAEYRYLAAVHRASKAASGQPPGETGLLRLRSSLAQHRRRLWRRRLLSGMTGGLVLVLASAALVSGHSEGDRYRPLGSAGSADSDSIQVRFQPSATQVELQALLHRLDLQVAAGPSALGVYHLRLRGARSARDANETLSQLRENPGLIEFAELEP